MTPANIDHPDDVPERVATALKDSNDNQLREIIHYAQQLLGEGPSLTDAIEARQGEELLRTEDHGAYTLAVVERPEEKGEARGPFAYHVKWEPNIDDQGGQYRWHYLGKIHDEAGEA